MLKKVRTTPFFIIIGFVFLAACSSTQSKNERIVFLDYDAQQIAQIYTLTLGSEQAEPLTTSATDILEYAISRDGAQIAFVTKEGNGGNSIWIMDSDGSSQEKIRNCPTATCNRLEWHPDGQRLLYEKRPFSTPNLPTIWWVDTTSGETVTVLTDPTEISSATAVSPDGNWLSYISLPTESAQFVNFATGERFAIQSAIDTPAVWHPNSEEAIIRDLNIVTYHGGEGNDHTEHGHDFSESLHLFTTNIQTQNRQILDQTGNVDDSNAVWSPDGTQIAFGRKISRTNTGRQLWVMNSDGQEAQALTENMQVQHGPPQWSENGRFLLHQQADLSQAQPTPSIWRYDLDTMQLEQLTNSGWFPNWLP